MDFGDVEVGILGALTALDDEGRADEFEAIGSGEILLHVRRQLGPGLGKGFIKHDHDTVDTPGTAAEEDLVQKRIGRRKNVPREKHPELETNLNGALNGRHHFILADWTRELEILFKEIF